MRNSSAEPEMVSKNRRKATMRGTLADLVVGLQASERLARVSHVTAHRVRQKRIAMPIPSLGILHNEEE
jgi:hypothetical protein